ncbi:uncharacterized protein LOC106160659 isoform X2 [Lingula anatina]|uniref:Uncharacterized protein LOC106160659 isoform X2 n=1 Tax=Lingula anatina TaxID=7574 RepID=A0A1S3I3C4_LINAN|nr:uncharacterized protein LOC106160659 isoform X2 [Lingula anatina]|eukprot:XP_013392770.1 uncharacterized protein LOC106160659 isoform X2 [Lingula anatina]
MSSSSERKKKSRKSKIHPDTGRGVVNGGFEMTPVESEEDNNRTSTFKNKMKNNKTLAVNALKVISNVRGKASKWAHYVKTRRTARKNNIRKWKVVHHEGDNDTEDHKPQKDIGLGEVDPGFLSKVLSQGSKPSSVEHNRALIHYFAKLGCSGDENEAIDLDYVEDLIRAGARVDCTDKQGQTVLHEAARAWHVDVAKFLIEHHANVNQPDAFGRTPLHVAASVDYAEMVNFLVANGANIEAKSKELQTPVHFAARNDAVKSLTALIKNGCEYKQVRDHKQRTPLMLAAQLDRSETARTLMEMGAPAGVTDCYGEGAVAWMITKMAPVAKVALDQFHVKDRANRKQYYYLKHLEPRKPDHDVKDTGTETKGYPMTAMQVAVKYRQYDILMHPVMQRLIAIKWRKFGRTSAVFNTLVNLVFIIVWTAIGIINGENSYIYNLPDQWWRILLYCVGVLLWIQQIAEEMREIYGSNKEFQQWKSWREDDLQKEIDNFCHPRWPEEKEYLEKEMENLDEQKANYWSNFWNVFDWICYFSLLISIIIHLVDVFAHTAMLSRWQVRINALSIIIIWLRLMKSAKAFSLLGPFIVMLGHILGDVIKFLFLYLEFYIPFSCAYWMLFGGTKVIDDSTLFPNPYGNLTVQATGFQDVGELIFSMFRLSMVDDYDYEGMRKADFMFADIMVAAWMALSAILCLNLFIALLSDTFQRVYDNAHANAVMQKAIHILTAEEGMSNKRREKFRRYIHEELNGVEETYYDDDLTATDGEEDLKKVTIQIKEQLDDMQEQWENNNGGHGGGYWGSNGGGGGKPGAKGDGIDSLLSKKGGGYDYGNPNTYDENTRSCVSLEKFENEVDSLREEIRGIRDRQDDMMDRFKQDITTITNLLQNIVAHQVGPGISPRPSSHLPPLEAGPGLRMSSLPEMDNLQQEQTEERRRRKELKKLRRQMKAGEIPNVEDADGTQSRASTHGPFISSKEPLIEVSTEYTDPPQQGEDDQRMPDIRIRQTVLNIDRMPSTDA